MQLSKIEPLLLLAETNPEVLVLIEAAGPDVLQLLPKIVDIAPGALPLLATAIGISPTALSALSVASLAGCVILDTERLVYYVNRFILVDLLTLLRC